MLYFQNSIEGEKISAQYAYKGISGDDNDSDFGSLSISAA